MKCPLCQAENLAGARSCIQCGFRFGQDQAVHEAETIAVAEPRDRLCPGSIFAGRYKIIEDLGSRRTGQVFKALDAKTNETIALKIIAPDVAADSKAIERLRDELQAAGKISHRNICRVSLLGQDKETYYIAMEYVQGESLKSMIHMTKRLRLGTIVGLARQICAGLAEAHRQGVIHGDLKSANIMVDQEGNARIVDLGTGAAAVPGTPEYLSPEQAVGQKPDQRSDIYSLGVILYEMVTGSVPFKGGYPPEILSRQIHELPEPLRSMNPELPGMLNRVILRCLEKKRESRYQSAEELLRDLEEAQTSIMTAVTRPAG